MKRLWIFLLVALLLAGCKKQPLPPSDSNDDSAFQDAESNSLYIPNSAVEKETGGAVRPYSVMKDTYLGFYNIGENLLIMGQRELMVLSSESATPIATLNINKLITAIDTAPTGVAYYQPNARLVVILNPQLQTVVQMTLPENVVGTPVISLARNEVFYSTGNEIRALNIGTGISRLLRQQTATTQSLEGVYFDGTVLLCRIVDEKESVSFAYISTETGEHLGDGKGVAKLQTFGQQYFAGWQNGTIFQSLFGTRGGESKCFLEPLPTDDDRHGRVGILQMNGAVEYQETEQGLELSFYELAEGKCTAQVMLSGVQTPEAIHGNGNTVWIVAAKKETAEQTLYRWDITQTPVEDATVHTGALYTAEKPDTEGITKCRERATTMEWKYGVKFVLWKDVTKYTGGHTVSVEHHPQVINGALDKLEPLLAKFPARFLQKTVEAGWIRISLVQSIEGDKEWVQFWENGDCWVLISMQGDVVQSLIQGMAYGIDSHVLGNSRDYDTWNELNPEGFAYASSYAVEEAPAYLEGENRAFVDALSMSYPHEDRARLFYHAMLPDNGNMFATPIMKAKLLRMCEGIREAYSLEKKSETYEWEQYLDTSLAYVEEEK